MELHEDSDIYKPTASRYAHLEIVDALAMTMAQEMTDETKENLRRIRASLTAYHGSKCRHRARREQGFAARRPQTSQGCKA